MDKVSQNPMLIIACPTLLGFEDDGHLLTLCMGAALEWYGCEKNHDFLSIFT